MATEHLHGPGLAGDGDAITGDPVGLLRDLEASGRFVRDSGFGRLFHPGRNKISYRQAVRENSLHVIIDGNRVSAHIDSVSPLVFDESGRAHYSLLRAVRYSFGRVVVHNLASFADALWRIACGQWNNHRCEFLCERIDVEDGGIDHYLDEAEHAAAPVAETAPPTTQSARRVAFSAIDQAVHLLDTDEAPWSIQLEARVTGSLDEARLRSALAAALERHPMARARKVAADRTRRADIWEITSGADVDPLDVVDCPDEAALDDARAGLQSTRVPLDTSPPLRARLARSPHGDVLMLNCNHAATDGFGGIRLLHSVARAYGGVADPAPQHDPLSDRELPVRLADAGRVTRVRRSLALAERLRDLVAPPARLAPRRAQQHEAGYGFHHVRLDADETRALVDRDGPGSVNDVLVAALHLAIAAWNSRQGQPCRRVTVLVPANLRPPRWRADVVGNFSVPARVTTHRGDRTSPAAALRAVTAQTSRKKRSGLGTALLQLLDRSERLPLWAKQALVTALDVTGNRFVDTAILSNLGAVDDPPSFGGDAGETTEMWFSAPGRMPLGLSVGALTVSGRLHLAFRHDRRLFDDAAARAFAEGYLTQLRAVTAAPGYLPEPASSPCVK